jgi:hypothetical protein
MKDQKSTFKQLPSLFIGTHWLWKILIIKMNCCRTRGLRPSDLHKPSLEASLSILSQPKQWWRKWQGWGLWWQSTVPLLPCLWETEWRGLPSRQGFPNSYYLVIRHPDKADQLIWENWSNLLREALWLPHGHWRQISTSCLEIRYQEDIQTDWNPLCGKEFERF